MNWSRAIGGGVLGAVIGLPVGFVLAILAHYTLVPTDYWNDSRLLPGLTLVLAAPFAVVGLRHGGAPTALTRRIISLLRFFTLGFVGGLLITAAIAIAAAAILDIPQREGAYAMGLVFVIMPFGGLVGGILLAIWSAIRG